MSRRETQRELHSFFSFSSLVHSLHTPPILFLVIDVDSFHKGETLSLKKFQKINGKTDTLQKKASHRKTMYVHFWGPRAPSEDTVTSKPNAWAASADPRTTGQDSSCKTGERPVVMPAMLAISMGETRVHLAVAVGAQVSLIGFFIGFPNKSFTTPLAGSNERTLHQK